MIKPNFFIVGAPKCGTTSLYTYLSDHPDIFMPDIKEPYYFGTDHVGGRFEKYRESEKHYLALFKDATGQKRIGEASPSYLSSSQAAYEIYTFNSEAKIIIMLRNPIDALYSMYLHRRFMGDEDATTFEEALIPILEHQTVVGPLSYADLTHFSPGVQRYFDVFGQENVHVIIFDDFKNDTAAVYRETLAFLEVDTEFQPTFTVVNASKQVRNPRLQRLLEHFGLTPKDLRDSTFYQSAVRLIPPKLYEALLRWAVRLYTQSESKMPLSEDCQTQLTLYFRPEIERLSRLLDRDLGHWLNNDSRSEAERIPR